MTGVTHQADSERPECLLVTLGEAGEVEGGESVLVPGVSTAQDGVTRPLLYLLQLSLLCEGNAGLTHSRMWCGEEQDVWFLWVACSWRRKNTFATSFA